MYLLGPLKKSLCQIGKNEGLYSTTSYDFQPACPLLQVTFACQLITWPYVTPQPGWSHGLTWPPTSMTPPPLMILASRDLSITRLSKHVTTQNHIKAENWNKIFQPKFCWWCYLDWWWNFWKPTASSDNKPSSTSIFIPSKFQLCWRFLAPQLSFGSNLSLFLPFETLDWTS